MTQKRWMKSVIATAAATATAPLPQLPWTRQARRAVKPISVAIAKVIRTA